MQRIFLFLLLICVTSLPSGEVLSQASTSPSDFSLQKSNLDSFEQALRADTQSGTYVTTAQNDTHFVKLYQLHQELSSSINKLKDKNNWASIIVSAIAVLVSALAVILGTIVQNRTIALTRANTLTKVNADRLKDWIDRLQKTLAEFMNVRYRVDWFFDIAMRNNAPFPGKEHWDLVQTEDRLHSNLQLQLDPSRESHKVLLDALTQLRDCKHRLEINEYRANVLNAARCVCEYEWANITTDNKI